MSSAASRPTGRRFGAYLLQGEVASGGQGTVWRALHQPSGQVVALKLLLASNPSAVKRFRQEARVLARLSHPHLLRVLDHGEVKGVPYLATELVDGQDLAARVKEAGIPDFAWTARALATVADTLQHCHEQGVVHRDVKPANILIERGSERPVLVDFGLVKRDAEQMQLASLDGRSQFSLSGAFKGTPEYMAPEQINEKEFGQVSPRTDVYGLGATLFHMLTGRPPFTSGRSTQPVVVLRKVTRKPAPDPAELNPRVPEDLARLCLRCLAKAPDQRPLDAAAVMRALRGFAGPGDTRADLCAPGSPSAPATLPGLASSRLGPFTLLGELGRGGMGVVFKARRDDGLIAAVKVLANVVVGEHGVKRFNREAKALADLDHPNVVRFLGASVTPPLWIAMEYVEGGDLSDCLAEVGTPAFDVTARLVAEVAEGIAHAHARGIMHRDLKPGNVLVTKDGRAVVTDFGMAKSLEASRFTQTGDMVGTLAFMAPEQARGTKDVGFPTDVWAIGALLYRCLAGTNPFDADSSIGLVGKILEGKLRPPRRWNADVPDDLQDTCLACLQRDAAARPSAPAVASALRERRGLARTQRHTRLPRALAIGVPLAALALTAAALAFAPASDLAAGDATSPTSAGGATDSDAKDPPPPVVARPAAPWPAAPDGWRRTWSAADGGVTAEPTAAWPSPDTAAPLASARAASEGAPVEGFLGEAAATRGGRVRVRYADLQRALTRTVSSPGDFFNRCPPPGGELQPIRLGEAQLLAPNDSSAIVLGVGAGRWSDARLDLQLRLVEHIDKDQLRVILGAGSEAPVSLTLIGRSNSAYVRGASVSFKLGEAWESVRLAPGDEATRVRIGRAPATSLAEAIRAHAPGEVTIMFNEVHAGLKGVVLEGRPLRPDLPAQASVPGALPRDARVLVAFERSGEGLGGPFVGLGPWGEGYSLELDGERLLLRRGVRVLAARDVGEASSGWLLLERRGDALRGWFGQGEEAFELAVLDPLAPPTRGPAASFGSTAPRVRFTRGEVYAGLDERDESPAARDWRRGAELLARASDPAVAEPAWRGTQGRDARLRAAGEAGDALARAALGLQGEPRLDALARAVLSRVVAADSVNAARAAERLVKAAGQSGARARVDGLRYARGEPALLEALVKGYTNVMDVDVREAALRAAAVLSPPDAPGIWVALAANIRNRRPPPSPKTEAGRAALLEAIELLERARQAGYADRRRLDGFQADYLLDLERYADALKYFDKIAGDSNNWWHWLRRAVCLEAMGRSGEALEAALGALAYARGRRQVQGFVLQLVRQTSPARRGGVIVAAFDALAVTARDRGLQDQAQRAARDVLRRGGEARQVDLAAFVLARTGTAPPTPPGDRATATLLRARAGDPEARRRLRQAAASDPLVRHLVLLDVELAPLLR